MELLTSVLQRIRKRGPQRRDGFIQLFISKRLIQGLAGAMMGMFLPIFLYEISGGKFWVVVLFFTLASVGYATFLVPGMKITNYIGFSKALALGAVFSVIQYILLFFTNSFNLWSIFPFLLVAIIGFRIFHWVPYHVDFTAFTKGGERGRDISLIFATIAFMGMLGPILAGYIVTNSGYDVLFGVCTLLLIAAGISYLCVPAVHEKFTWSYGETLKNLFSPKFRNVLVGEMANGAEVIVTLVAWPIFLYEVLQGNLLEIGMLSTVVVGVTIAVQLFMGKYLDAKSTSKVQTLKRGSMFYSVGWLIKIFVFSTMQIFFIGLYHNITRIFLKTPYSAILYDISGEQGRYVDEFTVMREIASHIGRTLALLTMLALTFYVPVAWTFVIGAVASLLVNAIYRATT